MGSIRNGIFIAFAWGAISCFYVSTFFIDPDPEKTSKDGTGPYWLSELKLVATKGMDKYENLRLNRRNDR